MTLSRRISEMNVVYGVSKNKDALCLFLMRKPHFLVCAGMDRQHADEGKKSTSNPYSSS